MFSRAAFICAVTTAEVMLTADINFVIGLELFVVTFACLVFREHFHLLLSLCCCCCCGNIFVTSTNAGYCSLDSSVSFIVPIETEVQTQTDISDQTTLGAMGKSSGSKKQKAICTNAISNTTQKTDRNLNTQHKQCKNTHRPAGKKKSSTK